MQAMLMLVENWNAMFGSATFSDKRGKGTPAAKGRHTAHWRTYMQHSEIQPRAHSSYMIWQQQFSILTMLISIGVYL